LNICLFAGLALSNAQEFFRYVSYWNSYKLHRMTPRAKSASFKAGGMMRLSRYWTKLVTFVFVAFVMGLLMVNFDNIFTSLNCHALQVSDHEKSSAVTAIPSKINFLDDDKKAFIDYCKKLYGSSLPLKIDDSIYEYYGTVNGYRFYRLQPSYISYDSISQQKLIGGYLFESPCRCRPEATGLYIISDKRIYTLEQAYDKGLVDISLIYSLYTAKAPN
jgi:hypothetical protein